MWYNEIIRQAVLSQGKCIQRYISKSGGANGYEWHPIYMSLVPAVPSSYKMFFSFFFLSHFFAIVWYMFFCSLADHQANAPQIKYHVYELRKMNTCWYFIYHPDENSPLGNTRQTQMFRIIFSQHEKFHCVGFKKQKNFFKLIYIILHLCYLSNTIV